MKLRHLLMWAHGVALCLALVEPAIAGGFLAGLLGMQESSPHAKPYAVLDENFYPTSVVWSPDGRYIADGGTHSRSIHIWDVAARKIVKSFDLKDYGVNPDPTFSNMAWSPDGDYLAVSVGRNKQMLVWDTRTWAIAKIFQEDTFGGSGSPTFSQDGKLLAMGRYGKDSLGNYTTHIVKVYSTADWHLVSMTDFSDTDPHGQGWGFSIDRVAFQPGTHNLAIGASGGFGFPPGMPIPMRNANGAFVTNVPTSSRVIFWNVDGRAPDLLTSDLDQSIIAYKGGWNIEALVFSPDGRQLATGTSTGIGRPPNQVTDSVHIFDPGSHTLLAAPLDGTDRVGHTDALGYIAGGKYLLVGHNDKSGTLDIIDVKTFKVADMLSVNGRIASLAVDPSRSRFVVTSDHKLMIWDFVDKP